MDRVSWNWAPLALSLSPAGRDRCGDGRDDVATPLRHHVGVVIRDGAEEEVVRAHARRIVAAVETEEPLGDGPLTSPHATRWAAIQWRSIEITP
jgi:hypothetical protein